MKMKNIIPIVAVFIILSYPADADILQLKDGKTIECVLLGQGAKIYVIEYYQSGLCEIQTGNIDTKAIAVFNKEQFRKNFLLRQRWKEEISKNCNTASDQKQASNAWQKTDSPDATSNPSHNEMDPDNFRGIKWGTDISTLTGMESINTAWKFVKAYRRKTDSLQIGEATLISIEYHFLDDKFCRGVMRTRCCDGTYNFGKFLDVVSERFGPDDAEATQQEATVLGNTMSLLWSSEETHKITTKFLSANGNTDEATFQIDCRDCDQKISELLKYEEQYYQMKVKEGARTGF